MKTEFKDINNPTTIKALHHLNEMYENARLALIEMENQLF